MHWTPLAESQHWLSIPAWHRPPCGMHVAAVTAELQTSAGPASGPAPCWQLPLQQSGVLAQVDPSPWQGSSAQYARCDFCPATIAWLTSVKAQAPAIFQCARCSRPLCEGCTRHVRGTPTCPPCGVLRRTRARLIIATVAALVVGGMIAVGLVVVKVLNAPKPKVLTPYEEFVERTEAELLADPCNRPKTQELIDVLFKLHDLRGVLARAETFSKGCPAWPHLTWSTYAAHRDLEEWEPAIADASKLIEAQPDDPDFWWWRGIVYARAGDLTKAAADYEHTVALRPGSNIAFNLAETYEKLGRTCDGLPVLKAFLAATPDLRGSDWESVQTRIERVAERGGCKL